MAEKQVFIAWVGDSVVFDPSVHARYDTVVLGWEIAERESEFATIDLQVPRTGTRFIPPGGFRHAHVSAEIGGQIVHLFSGRIAKFPVSVDDHTMTIRLVGKRIDWKARLATRLAAMKVFPLYDPLFGGSGDDLSDVMDGYTGNLQWSRTSNNPTFSHLFYGSRTVELGVPLEATVRQTGTPKKRCVVNVAAEWEQRVSGTIDLGIAIKNSFPADKVCTLDPVGFEARWPKAGTLIGGESGYAIIHSGLRQRAAGAGDKAFTDQITTSAKAYQTSTGAPGTAKLKRHYYTNPTLIASYGVAQRRVETAKIILETAVVEDEDDEQIEDIVIDVRLQDVTVDPLTPLWTPGTHYAVNSVVKFKGWSYKCLEAHVSSGNFLSDFAYLSAGIVHWRWQLQYTDQSPIGGPDRGVYFQTPRGKKSVDRAFCMAQAALAESLRCVEVTVLVPLDRAIDIDTDCSARVYLPEHGYVVGKVVSYRMWMNGGDAPDDGLEVVIGFAIGTGLDHAAGAGQYWINTSGRSVDTIIYTDHGYQPMPATLSVGAVASCTVSYPADEQEEELISSAGTVPDGQPDDDPRRKLPDMPTTIEISMEPLGGEDTLSHSLVIPAAHPWEGPKQIEV